MLIHLDATAITGCLEGPHVSECLTCLQELLRAHVKGHHLLSFDRDHGERLIEKSVWRELSSDHRVALQQIIATANIVEGARNAIRYHLLLGLGPDFDGRAVQHEQGRFSIHASLLDFDGVAAERSVLLCENMTDASFFHSVADLLLRARSSRMALSYDRREGSGSGMGRIAKHVAAEGKVLLGIADSDMSCAGGSRGETASGLLNALKDKPAFQHPHVLPTREAENLLPFTAFTRVLEDDRQSRASQLSCLSLLQRTLRTPEERAHADIKDGLTLHQLRNKAKPGAEQALWSSVAARRGLTRCKDEQNECTTERECQCYVVEKLGANILGDVVKWLSTKGVQNPRGTCDLLGLPVRSRKRAGEENKPLLDVAEKVIAWGCAPPHV